LPIDILAKLNRFVARFLYFSGQSAIGNWQSAMTVIRIPKSALVPLEIP
jgi:hypothetical protein